MYKQFQPDLILMDIKMPRMGGLEATRIIRSYSKEIPVIALTAYAFEADKEQALEAGCNDFVTKPVSKAALEEALGKCCVVTTSDYIILTFLFRELIRTLFPESTFRAKLV